MRKLPCLVHAIGLSLFIGALACILGPALATWLGQVPTSPAPKPVDYVGQDKHDDKFLMDTQVKFRTRAQQLEGVSIEYHLWANEFEQWNKEASRAASNTLVGTLTGRARLEQLMLALNRKQYVLNRLCARSDQATDLTNELTSLASVFGKHTESYKICESEHSLWSSRLVRWRTEQEKCLALRYRLDESDTVGTPPPGLVERTRISGRVDLLPREKVVVGTELPPSGPPPK